MKAYRKIKLIFSGRPVEIGKSITTYKEAGARIRKTIGKEPNEVFVALFLDGRHCEIGLYEVSRGTMNASLVHPRELFVAAISARADAIILAHNHPSGNSKASREDLLLTRRIVEAGNLIGIRVLDHLIITPTKINALRDNHASMFEIKNYQIE